MPTPLHVNEYGHGAKKIILVHGGPALYGYMKSLGDLLCDRYCIIDYAQRGTIQSQGTEEELTLDRHVADLQNLIKLHSKSGPLILMGHSWGAALVLFSLAQNAEGVEKAVLIGTSPLDPETQKEFEENLSSRLKDEDRTRLMSLIKLHMVSPEKEEIMKERLNIMFPLYHFDPHTQDNIPSSHWNYFAYKIGMSSLMEEHARLQPKSFKNSKTRLLALHGDYDPIPLLPIFNKLTHLIPSIEKVNLSQAGHFPWLEAGSKEYFLERLLRFLENDLDL